VSTGSLAGSRPGSDERTTFRPERYQFASCRLDLRRYIPTPKSCRFGTVKIVSFEPPTGVSYLTLTDSIDHEISKATARFLSK
jgi:hypothetical protein